MPCPQECPPAHTTPRRHHAPCPRGTGGGPPVPREGRPHFDVRCWTFDVPSAPCLILYPAEPCASAAATALRHLPEVFHSTICKQGVYVYSGMPFPDPASGGSQSGVAGVAVAEAGHGDSRAYGYPHAARHPCRRSPKGWPAGRRASGFGLRWHWPAKARRSPQTLPAYQAACLPHPARHRFGFRRRRIRPTANGDSQALGQSTIRNPKSKILPARVSPLIRLAHRASG